MAVADCFDGVDPRDDLGRRGPVVPGVAPGEDAGVQRAANHDRCAGLEAFRQQVLDRPLLEQGIPAGEEERVPDAPLHGLKQHLAFVDPDADRPYRAAISQTLERAIAAVAQCLHQPWMSLVAVRHCADVMHIEDVDPRKTEPLQTVLERAHDPIVRIVINRIERHWGFMFPGLPRRRARTEQTSNFRRQHPIIARFPAHCISDATLGLTETVIGGGVDIAHSGRPGGVHDGFGFAMADLDATTPEGSAAETQRRDFERSPSDPALLENRHRAISHSPYISLWRRSYSTIRDATINPSADHGLMIVRPERDSPRPLDDCAASYSRKLVFKSGKR